jgi:hypothetical protein
MERRTRQARTAHQDAGARCSAVRRRLFGAMVLLALVAAACSGGDDDIAEPSPTEPAVVSSEATTPPEDGDDADGGADADEPEPEEATAEPAPDVPRQVVRIGYAYPDLSAFATLNAEFSIGDPELQADAVVDMWRREGLLPAGIDIELVFASYNILDSSAKLGVCTKLAQDEEVFAVVSGLNFTIGSECLATRFATPVIDTEGAPPSLYQRGAPWLFTLRTDYETQLANYGQWALDLGVLQGQRVGIYFETALAEGVAAMRELFDQAGIEVVSVTETSGEGIGSPEDQVSVRRFIDDEAEVVLPLVGGSSAINVYSFAEGQNYRPVYLDLDYAEHTSGIAAATNPVEQYDGTLAMTMTRVGERAGGLDVAGAEACVVNYERFAGEDISRDVPESGKYASVLRTCDLFAILHAGLEGAAADLSPENFVAALETAGEIELVGSANGSFTPDDHSLVDQYRTIQWDASCPCWRALNDFSPMLPAG